MRLWVRTAAAATALALVGTLATGGPAASQQPNWFDFRVEATGTVTATSSAVGRTWQTPVNTPHTIGSVGGVTVTAQGIGTCRIIVDGQVVSEHPGPVAHCQHRG